MDSAAAEPRASWNDRVFAWLPAPPYLTAAVVALALVGAFLATAWASGDLAAFMARDTRWWEERDGRIGVILAVLAGYLPAARRQHNLATAENLGQLRPVMEWDDAALGRARDAVLQGGAAAGSWAGFLTLALFPLSALLVDREPTLYFQRHYWGPAQIWTWLLGGWVTWHAGRLFHASFSQGRLFGRLAGDLPEIDLLALDRLEPFARQGARSALLPMVILSLLALNLVDRAFLPALGLLTAIALAIGLLGLWMPVRTLSTRIAATKRAELARVNAAIRGDGPALEASLISRRAERPSLADLLQYRSFVEAVPEWGIAARVRGRLLLYVALPVGSWLGGAFVERVLEAALG